MTDPDYGRDGVSPLAAQVARERGELSYSIELWDEGRQSVERVLARAVSASLGHAIFTAAQNEHPGRYITLRHGSNVLAKNA